MIKNYRCRPLLYKTTPIKSPILVGLFLSLYVHLSQEITIVKAIQQDTTTFLNYNVIYHPPPLSKESSLVTSSVACVGENFNQHTSYMYRSCQFQNLCYNTKSQEFLFFQSKEEIELQDLLFNQLSQDERELIAISSIVHDTLGSSTKKVSLGTVRTGGLGSNTQKNDLPWFPTTVGNITEQNQLLSNGYYQLPSDTALFPLRLPLEENSFSLLWNDFFSIHTILTMFGLETKRPIFLIHNSKNSEMKLSSSLFSVFGIESDNNIGFVYNKDTSTPINVLNQNGGTENVVSDIVCSDYGVAGLGMIAVVRATDTNSNNGNGPILTHSLGRGALLWTFREYILNNLNIIVSTPATTFTEIKIEICADTKDHNTWLNELPINIQQKANDSPMTNITIHNVQTNLSFPEKCKIAATSQIYIIQQSCSFMLAVATCLPRDATLIVVDTQTIAPPTDEINAKQIEQDYLRMAGYFQLHWYTIPSSHIDDHQILQNMVNIVFDQIPNDR